MTETAVTVQVVSAVSNLLGNTPLEKAMHDNLLRLGPPPFDAADRDFAHNGRSALVAVNRCSCPLNRPCQSDSEPAEFGSGNRHPQPGPETFGHVRQDPQRHE
jgi:hypothetical protein